MLRQLSSKVLAINLIGVLLVYLIFAILRKDRVLLDSYLFFVLGLALYLNLLACLLVQFKKFGIRKAGSVGLHLGLVLILSGNGINYLFEKHGFLQLGLGQTKAIYRQNLIDYSAGKLATTWQDELEVKLQDLSVDSNSGYPRIKHGTLVVLNNKSGVIQQIPFDYVNSFEVDGINFWPHERGYAPLLELPEELIHWSLATQKKDGVETYRGNIVIRGVNVKGLLKEGKLFLYYSVDGKNYETTIKPGEVFYINNAAVRWVDTSFWIVFSVTDQPGNSLIWSGAIISIIGTAVHYLQLLWKKE